MGATGAWAAGRRAGELARALALALAGACVRKGDTSTALAASPMSISPTLVSIDSTLRSIDSTLASIDCTLRSIDSTLRSIDSALRSIDSNLGSIDSTLVACSPNVAAASLLHSARQACGEPVLAKQSCAGQAELNEPNASERAQLHTQQTLVQGTE
eukprot:1151665-Pleurochrysis_carterae.AAC.1